MRGFIRLIIAVSSLLILLLALGSGQLEATDRFLTLFSGQARLLDLTYPLNQDNPYWPAKGFFPFTLNNLTTLEKEGVYSNSFSMPEHLGTHIDAPNHFVKGHPSLDQLPLDKFFGPAAVIDIKDKVDRDPDYLLSIDDIKEWEGRHGPIPSRAIVLLYTGWGRYWSDGARYRNQDQQGRMHFPGYSPEAARFLLTKRDILAMGIDTLSVDRGISKDYAVHHLVLSTDRYFLENVANLDKMPALGAYLIVAPIKIERGSGGPVRVIAILP